MEKLLKKVRIYHFDSNLHFQSSPPPPPQTGPLPVSGNLKYTPRNPRRLDRGKINWIPAVKLASDRLWDFFFSLPPARWSYGQRSTGGGWSAMGIRRHRTQSKRHLKTWPGFKAHPYMIKQLIITIRISSNLIVAVTTFFSTYYCVKV